MFEKEHIKFRFLSNDNKKKIVNNIRKFDWQEEINSFKEFQRQIQPISKPIIKNNFHSNLRYDKKLANDPSII